MKRIIIVLFYLFSSAFSQDWSAGYSFGYGTYQLNDIKAIQNSIQRYMDQFGAKTIENFPGWYTHTGNIGYITNHHHFGIIFSYLTTGGRSGVTDYSGSYYTNITMNGYRLGAFYRYYINIGLSKLNIYLQASSGIMFSTMKMTESINVGTESDSYREKMISLAEYIEPSAGIIYHLADWLSVSVSGV